MITKMVLLDKFKDQAQLDSYVLVEDLQEFIGTDLYEFDIELNEYVSIGEVTSIDIDQEEGSLKVNDKVSFYDDFDFDFEVIDGELLPLAIYVLEIDENAVAPAGLVLEDEPEDELDLLSDEPEDELDLEE